MEASKPSKTAAAAAAAGATGAGGHREQHKPKQTFGGWCSGLTSAFGCDSSGSSDGSDGSSDNEEASGSESDPESSQPAADMQQQEGEADPNNISTHSSSLGGDATAAAAADAATAGGSGGGGQHRQQRRQQRRRWQQQPELSLSSAWSVFEQQLAALHSQQRALLILATTQLPVQSLPGELQQLFGWQAEQAHAAAAAQQQHPPQSQMQQEDAGCSSRGMSSSSCCSGRTVQVCGQDTFKAAVGAQAAAAAAGDRVQQVPAAGVDRSLADSDALHNPLSVQQQHAAAAAAACGSASVEEPASPLQPQPPQQQEQRSGVDALISAAVQQKEQQRRQAQRQLPARVSSRQVLAAQQLGAALQQLNDAQKAEATALLAQVRRLDAFAFVERIWATNSNAICG